jgi:hypothetical protein
MKTSAARHSAASATAFVSPRAAAQPDQRPATVVQRQLQQAIDASPRQVAQRQQAARLAARPNKTGLPDQLKAGMEHLSGHSLDDVRVHYNSGQPAQLQALAYAQGTHIHVAPGQEHHLPHEAWHVVQQKQGRVKPTLQLRGVHVNDNTALEHEADVLGTKALQLKSMPATASRPAPASTGAVVQRIKNVPDMPGHVEVGYDEQLPQNDGYNYVQVGSGPSGRIYRQVPVPYQRTPTASASATSSPATGSNYNTNGTENNKGGLVTPNSSPFFPAEGAVDAATYSRNGYSRIIGPDDLEDNAMASVNGMKQKGANIIKALTGGASFQQTMQEQGRLVQDDPRVTHYLAIHTGKQLTEAALSTAASLGTGGASSIVQSGMGIVGKAGLGAEFHRQAAGLQAHNDKMRPDVHSQADQAQLHPQELIGALQSMGTHYAGDATADGVASLAKMIPLVGSLLGGAKSLGKAALGSSQHEALTTILQHAQADHPGALSALDLLGVPREVALANGGEKVLKTRL